MVKVSIITITLNDLDGLIRTRTSILEQSFSGELEHVIVDGTIDPKTIQYLDRNSTGISSKLIPQKTRGIYEAMNQGISESSGDVLWFLNSGDYFASRFAIELAVNSLELNWDRWGVGVTQILSEENEHVGLAYPFPYRWDNQLLGIDYVPHPSSFFGKGLIQNIGEYDVEFATAADQIFMLRAANIKLPVECPHVLTVFSLGGLSSTTPRKQRILEIRNGVKKYSLIPNSSVIKQYGLQLVHFIKCIVTNFLEINFKKGK